MLFYSTGLLYYLGTWTWIGLQVSQKINLTYWKYHKCDISKYKQVRQGEVSLRKREQQRLSNDNHRHHDYSRQNRSSVRIDLRRNRSSKRSNSNWHTRTEVLQQLQLSTQHHNHSSNHSNQPFIPINNHYISNNPNPTHEINNECIVCWIIWE